jgi:SMC interacting uncharacterized protein involved in chromosome segregation
MPQNLEQIQNQLNMLNKQKDDIQKKVDMHNLELEKLQKQKEDIQKKLDALTGNVEEEADAGITTSTAGNISVAGGQGNYAPRFGMYRRKKLESILNFIDKIFE